MQKPILLICRIATLTMPFVTTGPLFRALGSDLYGCFVIANSVAATMGFLDLGIHDATLTKLARCLGRGDNSEARRILGTSYILLIIIAGVITLGFGALVLLPLVVVPLQAFTLSQPAVFACVLLPQVFLLPCGLLNRLLQAQNNHATAAIMQVLGPALATIVTLGLIWLNIHGVPLILSMTVTPLVVSCGLHMVYFSHHPTLLPFAKGINWKDAADTLKLSARFVTVSACVAFVMAGDNLLLSFALTPEEVLEFAIPARLGLLVPTTVALLCLPIWAACGSAYTRRESSELMHHIIAGTVSGLVFLSIVTVPLLFFDDAIMHAWVGRTFRHQRVILAGYVALGFVIALSSPWNMLLNAAGNVGRQVIPWLAVTLSLACIKPMLLTPGTAWLAPWLTAAAYAVFVSPTVLLTGMRLIRDAQTSRHDVPTSCSQRQQAA